MIPGDAWDEGEPGKDAFPGITKGEEHPGHLPEAVEGEDVTKATRNLAHGQSLDLRWKGTLRTDTPHPTRRWNKGWTYLVETLEFGHRLDKAGVIGQMLPQDVPELRLAGRSGHGFYLGIPARRGLQARNLLAQLIRLKRIYNF